MLNQADWEPHTNTRLYGIFHDVRFGNPNSLIEKIEIVKGLEIVYLKDYNLVNRFKTIHEE